MYDAWDSVSVVGTSLFLPQAITALSSAAGSQAPRALWSFLGSVSTGVSIAAFLAIGPIAEYSDLRVRLMRPCSLAGAAAMLLFLAVQHPSMLWLAALSVVVMRVANRAAASTATSSAALLVADELGVSSLELAAIAVLGMVTAAGGATGWRLLVRAGILSGTAALHVAILVLSAVLGWVAFMASRWELYALTVIAGVQLGAIASFTRSLLVSMTPRDEQARIGALYELTQKGTSWIGPLAIGAAVQAMGEQHYRAIVVITVAVEVAIGWPMFLLCVNERRGAHAAAEFDRVREAERGGAASPSQGSGRAVAKQAAGAGATGAPAGRNTPPPMPNEVLSPLVLATRAAAKRGPQAPSAPAGEACSGGALVGVAGPPATALQASLLRSKSAAMQL
ncbi:hypothetical protein FNF27_05618 [Cafeteria roenbergensis]|uniref:Major facilitator superfamily (MFS) profile domain-containing protein n=1 Tax=Cafeteria roenbergensis TaxID=33653 RepID=A0A5A8E6X1_CAFRO|nr:hypothetical protein FNF27_05618 [Cafeteria roenbergensis]